MTVVGSMNGGGAASKGLVAKGLVRAFGGVRAVNNVSFVLRPGETLALIGPNGAGKSTIVQLLSGVERPDEGRIQVDGTRIDGLAPEKILRKGVGRTFQTSRVFPALSVWDSVLIGNQCNALRASGGRLLDPFSEVVGVLFRLPFWRRRVAEQAAEAEAIIKLFGDRLWPRRNDPAFSLSYANRRRLEIARVLASKPRYLLLDEPTAGMNPTETAELTQLLLELRRLRPDLGILIIEHKLSVVRQVADRVIVMNQGKALVEDTPDRALDHPEVVEAYLGRSHGEREKSDAHLG